MTIPKNMTSFYEEVEIEDFVFDEDKNLFHYPCPCGDRFEITLVGSENDDGKRILNHFPCRISCMMERRLLDVPAAL